MAGPSGAVPFLASLMGETWALMRQALYLDGFVFADNSMYPRSLRRAWWGMEVRDALHTWDPSRATDLKMDRARVVALLAEKQAAVRIATALANRARMTDAAVPAGLQQRLAETFALTESYVRGFALCAEVCVLARWTDPAQRSDDGPGREHLAQLERAIAALEAFAASLRGMPGPHQRIMLMDHRRIADIVREAREVLESTKAPT